MRRESFDLACTASACGLLSYAEGLSAHCMYTVRVLDYLLLKRNVKNVTLRTLSNSVNRNCGGGVANDLIYYFVPTTPLREMTASDAKAGKGSLNL